MSTPFIEINNNKNLVVLYKINHSNKLDLLPQLPKEPL